MAGEEVSGPKAAPSNLRDLPLLLTVAEASTVLRISRSAAYKFARQWEATGGRTGLPVVRLGSRLMVRRVDLARILGTEAA